MAHCAPFSHILHDLNKRCSRLAEHVFYPEESLVRDQIPLAFHERKEIVSLLPFRSWNASEIWSLNKVFQDCLNALQEGR